MARWWSLPAVVLIAPGCATIVSGGPWNIQFAATTPTQFEVFDENGARVAMGTTPATIALQGHDGYFDGATYTVKSDHGVRVIDSSLNGWYFGNLIFGGLIGFFVVDPLTGDMWRLTDRCQVPEPPAAAAGL